MVRSLPAAILIILTFVACSCAGCKPDVDGAETQDAHSNWNGESWRAEIQLPEVTLPVSLNISLDGRAAWFVNGLELVEIGQVSVSGNQYDLVFPAFNNSLKLRREGDQLSGTLTLVKRGYEQYLPVVARPHPGYRFTENPQPEIDVTGRWEVYFTDVDGNVNPAIGEFDQQGASLSGTFLTPTGDYRYLAGDVDGRTMRLSTFDGAHAFVFTASLDEGGELRGDFWSGSHWHETWRGRKNYDASLPDAYSLTELKPGFEKIDLVFPDLEGKPVSLADVRFRDKVVLVTLSGTWCPNCGDASEFLSAYYRENRHRGLEVVTLLFEHFEDFETAAAQGRALVEKHEIEFDVLVAGYSDKTKAAEALPMLDRVVAYPTIIFVDRKGLVRKIHTGFSGPGTGSHYADFVRSFNELMDSLLQESTAGLIEATNSS